MKTGKKVMILLLIFVAAVIVYFIHPVGKKEEHGITEYTAMEKAKFPVLYATMGEREMAPVFGQTEERGVTADRGSLIVLPEDRKLKVRFAGTTKIQGLRYEIRSLDTENLIERTQVTSLDAAINGDSENAVSAELLIQNLLETGKEYLLGVCASLPDGSEAWYYMRIVEQDQGHVNEMLALAEEFSSKTYKYSDAQSLAMYMETSPSANSSALGTVTLKDTFTQLTWGSLGVERTGEAYTKLKELSGNLANVEIATHVTAKDGEKTETYEVTENFTMKWASQRIYMMDYERTMTELFTGDSDLFSGKRIILGIGNGDGVHAVKSDGGQYTAFVTGRELWAYDSGENVGARVFAFGGAASDDIRDNVPEHGVEILSVDEDGGIDFIVYGRMNRGTHEGSTGIAYYHYAMDQNALEEKFFIPSTEPFEELKDDLSVLAHRGTNGIFYFYMDHGIYGIDLKSLEYVALASGLTKNQFAVSADHSRAAWQENTGIWDSQTIQIMDLDTGDKTQLGGQAGSVSRIFGFVGNDCIYGTGDSGDYLMSNGRVMGVYLKSIDIVDREMKSVMHYEKPGSWIREVSVNDSRIHMKTVTSKDGFFGTYSADTLVCNAEILPGKADDIGWYASDQKGQVLFVQLDRDIETAKKIRQASPKLAESRETVKPIATAACRETEFYAYGRGRFLGRFVEFSDAAETAYNSMGFVTAGRDRIIWVRGNRASASYIRDITSASRLMERYLDSFEINQTMEDGTFLLDASGSTIIQVLYFVGQNIPVLAYTGEGTSMYLTGYDQTHVRVYHPESGATEVLSMETANQMLGAAGYDFICCVPTL